MPEAMTVAYIGAGASLAVALLGTLAQLFTTRWLVRSEYEKIAAQVREESQARAVEKRHDRLVDALAALLAAADPKANRDIDGKHAELLGLRVWLHLDPERPGERAVEEALDRLFNRLEWLEETKTREPHDLHLRMIDVGDALTDVMKLARKVIAAAGREFRPAGG